MIFTVKNHKSIGAVPVAARQTTNKQKTTGIFSRTRLPFFNNITFHTVSSALILVYWTSLETRRSDQSTQICLFDVRHWDTWRRWKWYEKMWRTKRGIYRIAEFGDCRTRELGRGSSLITLWSSATVLTRTEDRPNRSR